MSGENSTSRIMLVESGYTLRAVFRAILSFDYPAETIFEVDSGEDALLEIPILQPDLLITELDFFGLSRTDLIRSIQNLAPQLKIIVLTAIEDEYLAQEVLACGVNAYCLKGLPLQELLDVIHKVQQGESWIDPRVLEHCQQPLEPVKEKQMPHKKPSLPIDFRLITNCLHVILQESCSFSKRGSVG